MNLDDVELNNKHDFAARHTSELLSIIVSQRIVTENFLKMMEEIKHKQGQLDK